MINFTKATIGKTTKTFKNPTSMRSRLNILKFLSAFALVMLFGVNGVIAQSYTSTSASSAWNASRWNNSTDAAPYTSTFTANNAASFTSGAYTFAGMGATVNVGNVTVASGVTVNFPSIGSTYATGGAVRTFDIGSGGLFDFQAQAFSTAAGTGLIKSGAGVFGTGAGAFTGGFTLNAGTVIVRGTTGLGSGTGNILTLNGGTIASNGNRALENTRFPGGIVIGGNVQFGELATVVSLASSTANLSFANNVSLGGAVRTFTQGNNGTNTFSAVISNTSGGLTFAANANTDGRFEFTNIANTFTGNINVNGGEVRFTTDGSIGNAANDIIIDGGRFAKASDATTVTLGAGREIQVGDGAGTSISSPGSGVLVYNNPIINKSGETGAWAKQGGGALELGGVSTYTGSTAINNGILRLTTGNDRLPAGTVLSLGQAASVNLGTFDLNGRNQTIGGLNSTTGTNVTASNNNDITSSTSATLTVNGAGSYGDGTDANSGIISASISLVKSGSGTLTLGDVNTYTGTTTINAGTLSISSIANGGTNSGIGASTNAATNLVLGGGTLQYTGSTASTDRNFTLTAATTSTINNTNQLTITGASTATTGALTKAGAGTLILSGTNLHTGATTISAGTLALSGSGSIASSTITVASGATFDISGRSATLTLAAGQSLRSSATGSNSTATVTVGTTPTLTLSAGGLGFTDYGGGATAPMTVAGAGSLALASSPVTVTTTTALAAGTYTLIAKSGSATVTGTPGALTMAGSGLAASTTGALSVVSGELILTVTSSGGTPPTLTAAGSATVDAAFDVTFTDDATWRAAITSITVGGTTLTAGSAVTAGQIAFTPSASAPASLLQSSGSKSIVVIAAGYTNATVTQSIGVGAATKLGITTQPTAPASNGGALAAQPVVAIQDQYNNTTTSTATIAAAVGAGTWTLGSTTSVAAVGGTATYSGLTATSAASVTGATIAFTSAGLTGVTSGTFTIPAPPVAPTVTSPTSASIVNTTATLGSNVTSDGGAAITARGVVWSVDATNNNPTIGGGGVTNVVGTGTTGVFTVNAAGLPPNTIIAYRAYATNSVGTTYTTATTFTTLSVATKLVFGTAPAGTGNVGVNLTTFTVQAQRADNSIDAEYVANVTLARNIVSGSAALTGTTSVAAVAGTATFSAAQFNAVGTYTITASSAALTTTTSSNIVVSLAPVVIYQNPFESGTLSSPSYTGGTTTLAANLSNSVWTIGAGTLQLFGGSSGNALGVSSGTTSTPYTLTFSVASGYQLSVSSYSFWKQTSSSALVNSVTINGITVSSGAASSSTGSTGTLSVANTVSGLTGTITVVLNITGSGSFRLDDFTLNGNVVCLPATASVLSTPTPAICNGGAAGNLRVTITGGASPFSVVYNDGTGNTTQTSYTSGSNISVTPSSPTTYTLVSVTDANSCVSNGLSGSATITPVSGAANTTLAGSSAAPIEQCTDGAGWTYYATSAAPTQLLFAIKKNGNTFTATPNITVGSTIVKTSSNGANQQHGMWLMGRYWDATLASGSISISNPVSVRFYYNPADATAAMTARDNAFTALPGGTLAVKNSASGEWFKTPNGTTLNAGYISSIVGNKFPAGVLKPTTVTGTENGVNYVEYQGLTGFSGGTLGFSFGPNNGGGANSLPVTWAYFTAQKTDGGNQLDWGTASEKNTSHFEIEYSVDGSQFIAMNNKINAAGNSAHLLEYRCIHKLSPPLIYYRIKQIDLDGLYDYSKTIILKNKDVTSKNFIKVLPSYVQGQEPLTIQGYESNMPFVFYEIINGQGQRILSDKIPTIDGYFHHNLSLEMYPTGLYYLRVFNSDLDNIYQGKIRK